MPTITAQINGSLTLNDLYGAKQVQRQVSVTSTGGGFFARDFQAGTAAATLAHGLATLRYANIVNPTDSGATITVSMAPAVLRPGDVLLAPPGAAAVTVQASGTATVDFAAGGVEA
jgi:hypothetical protein